MNRIEKIETKLEDTIMYGYEEILYRYFRAFQDPKKYSLNGLKKINNFEQYYFMSERFYRVYQVLLQKYPELKLQKDVYHQGESIPKQSTLYINDVIAELPSKIGFSDRMMFTILSSLQYFYIEFEKGIIGVPWTNNDKELDSIKKDSTLSWSMKRKSTAILYMESIRESLNFLGLELQYLKNNGVFNAYDLAPISVKKYFKIIFENSEQIRYFLSYVHKLQCEGFLYATSDKDLLLIQKKALKQTKNYFKEDLNIEILTFFATINSSYFNFYHFPLEYSFDDICKKLSSLSKGIYDELARKDFSYEKLINKGQQYRLNYIMAIEKENVKRKVLSK